MNTRITTHVLDTSRGVPAANLRVTLETRAGEEWKELAKGTTNAEGRLHDLVPEWMTLAAGTYRLTFYVGPYFESVGGSSIFPYVPVIFEIRETGKSYHIPLLVNPFGYSTYRGQ